MAAERCGSTQISATPLTWVMLIESPCCTQHWLRYANALSEGCQWGADRHGSHKEVILDMLGVAMLAVSVLCV